MVLLGCPYSVTSVTLKLLCLVVAMGSFYPYDYRCKDINHINKGVLNEN